MKRTNLALVVVPFAVLAVSVAACSSGSAPAPNGSDAGTEAAATEAGSDAADAGAEAAPIVGCAATRVKKSAECSADCDARLLLPAGDTYCTLQCTGDSECASHGTGLKCSTETGTCMPRCTTPAECTNAGFARCDLTVGACDTI